MNSANRVDHERGFLAIFDGRKMALTALILALLSGLGSAAQSAPSDTFTMTISLVAPTIHVGEVPIIEVITENSTPHIVFAGWTEGDVELINDKGVDIGQHVIGNTNRESESVPAMELRPRVRRLEPGYHFRGNWQIRTDPGYLTPGTYKVRVHRLDVKSGAEVYSNTVTLTVNP